MDDTERRIHVAVALLLAVFLVADLNGTPELDPIEAVVLLGLGIGYAGVLFAILLAYGRQRV